MESSSLNSFLAGVDTQVTFKESDFESTLRDCQNVIRQINDFKAKNVCAPISNLPLCEFFFISYVSEITHAVKREMQYPSGKRPSPAWAHLQLSLADLLAPLTDYTTLISKESAVYIQFVEALKEHFQLEGIRTEVADHNAKVKQIQFEDRTKLLTSVEEYLGELSQKALISLKESYSIDQVTLARFNKLQASDSIRRMQKYLKIGINVWTTTTTTAADKDKDDMFTVALLAIERTLQVCGEYLKSSEQSSHLPTSYQKQIKAAGSVPVDTFSSLRDKLSHSNQLLIARKLRLGKWQGQRGSIEVYEQVVHDLKQLDNLLDNLLLWEEEEVQQLQQPVKSKGPKGHGGGKKSKRTAGAASLAAPAAVQKPYQGINSLFCALCPKKGSESAFQPLNYDTEFMFTQFLAAVFEYKVSEDSLIGIVHLISNDSDSLNTWNGTVVGHLSQWDQRIQLVRHLQTLKMEFDWLGSIVTAAASSNKSTDSSNAAKACEELMQDCRLLEPEQRALVQDFLIEGNVEQLVKWTTDLQFNHLYTKILDDIAPIYFGEQASTKTTTDPEPAFPTEELTTTYKDAKQWFRLDSQIMLHLRTVLIAANATESDLANVDHMIQIHQLMIDIRQCPEYVTSDISKTLQDQLLNLLLDDDAEKQTFEEIFSKFAEMKRMTRDFDTKLQTNKITKFLTEQKNQVTFNKLWKSYEALLKSCVQPITFDSVKVKYKRMELESLEEFFKIRLNQLEKLLVPDSDQLEGSGLTQKLLDGALQRFASSPAIQAGTELLLLDLSDLLKCISSLLDLPNLEGIISKIGSLSTSPLLYNRFLIRNYLAHGDFVLDSLNAELASSVVNNALDLVLKGPSLIQCCQVLLLQDVDGDKISRLKNVPYGDEILHHLQWNTAGSGEAAAAVPEDEPSSQPPPPPAQSQFNLESRFGANVKSLIFKEEMLDSIRRDDLQKLQSLLSNPVSMAPFESFTLLHHSVIRNSPTVFNFLITSPDLLDLSKCIDVHGVTPLHLAIAFSQHHFVLPILNASTTSPIPIHATVGSGNSAIELAARLDAVDVVQALLEAGAEAQDALSVSLGNLDLLKLLLRYGAKPSKWSPILHYVPNGEHQLETVSLLLEHGADINYRLNGETRLGTAVRYCNIDLARLLIDKHARTTDTQLCGRSLLCAAVESGRQDLVEYLAGIIHEPESPMETSPLHFATKVNNLSMVKALIEIGKVPVNVRQAGGATPIGLAVSKGSVEMVRYLIEEAGAEFRQTRSNLVKSSCARPLDSGILQYLLTKLPEKEYLDQHCVFTAAAAGRDDVLQFLHVDKGMRLDVMQGDRRVNPLMLAIVGGHLNVVQFILKHRKLQQVIDSRCWTSFHYACHHGNQQIFDCLMDNTDEDTRQFIFCRQESAYGKVLPSLVQTSLEAGHLEMAKHILDKYKAYFKLESTSEYSALHQAVILSDSAILRQVLSTHANEVGFRSTAFSDGRNRGFPIVSSTPVGLAVSFGRFNLVKVFLDFPGVSLVQDEILSIANKAIEVGNTFFLEYLLSKGLDLDENATRLIQRAINDGNTAAVGLLFKKGVAIADSRELEKLITQARGRGRQDLTELLQKHYSDQGFSVSLQDALLSLVNECRYDGLQGTEALLKILEQIQADDFDYCPAIRSASWGDVTMFKTLLIKSNFKCLREGHSQCVDPIQRWLFNYDVHKDDDLLLFQLENGGKIFEPEKMEVILLEKGVLGLDDATLAKIVNMLRTDGIACKQLESYVGGPNLLHKAAERGNLATVKELLQWGFDPCRKTEDGEDPMCFAISREHLAVVEHLLEVIPRTGTTAEDSNISYYLERSVWSGSPEIVRLFLNQPVTASADVDSSPVSMSLVDEFKDGMTLFLYAINHHYTTTTTLLKLLLDLGSDVNAISTTEGATALHIAARKHNHMIVRFLVEEQRLDVNARTKESGKAPLHCLLESSRSGGRDILTVAELVKYLANVGARVNETDNNGNTSLGLAIEGNWHEAVKSLIDLGADIRQLSNGQDLIFIAASVQRAFRLECIKFLCNASLGAAAAGVDLLQVRNPTNGKSVLHYAARHGSKPGVEFILAFATSHGINLLELVDNDGNTVLHDAVVGKGNTGTETSVLGVVKLLLSAGFSANAQNNDGNTSIHLAAKWGKTKTFQLLVEESSGDPLLVNNAGETALALQNDLYGNQETDLDLICQLVIDNDFEGLQAAVIARLADPGLVAPSYGTTCLHAAISRDQLEMVRWLLEEGRVNVNALDANGDPPLKIAVDGGLEEICSLLMEFGADHKYGMRDRTSRSSVIVSLDKLITGRVYSIVHRFMGGDLEIYADNC